MKSIPSSGPKKAASFWLFFLLLLLQIFAAKAQYLHKSLNSGQRERNYILHLPAQYESGHKWPVIIALHGGGGTAENVVRFYGLEKPAEAGGYILVYPDAVNKAWNIPGMTSRVKGLDSSVDDLQFMEQLIDTLISSYHADAHRIYLTGMSRGAMFSLYLASALNQRVAGIAAVCGGISRQLAASYHFQRPIPVLMINGTRDPLVSYQGGAGKFNRRNRNNEGADLLPAEELVQKLRQLNHSSGDPIKTVLPDKDATDGCTAIEYSYGSGQSLVDFIQIKGAGHTWPGGSQYLPRALVGRVCQDFSAGEKVVAFFNSIQQDQ